MIYGVNLSNWLCDVWVSMGVHLLRNSSTSSKDATPHLIWSPSWENVASIVHKINYFVNKSSVVEKQV